MKKEHQSTTKQIAEAMKALGMYSGENTDQEHAKEEKRLGSKKAYHAQLTNALLGAVEGEALLTDSSGLTHEQMDAAHRQALQTAGAGDDPLKLLAFLQWRLLRVEGPLRQMAQDETTGPIVLAAAHAGQGLHQLLAVCAAGQDPESIDPDELTLELKEARESLQNSIANIDIFLELIEKALS